MEELQSNNKYTVAFLDILGFRKAVLNTPLSKLADKYERQIGLADAMNRPQKFTSETPTLFPNHPLNAPWCQRFVFSDSIVLISNDEKAISVLKLLVYTWRLSQLFIANQMPLRGGIAFGELFVNPTRNIFIGRALTTAYDLEQSQEWIGISIHPSVVDAFPEIFPTKNLSQNPFNDIFLLYPVPLKDNNFLQLRTINWRFNLIVEKGTRSLFLGDGQSDVAKKIENTLRYAEEVVGSGRIYVSDQSALPVKLRSMWIGAKEPPFLHGDDL